MYILENKYSFNAYHSMSGKKCSVNRDLMCPLGLRYCSSLLIDGMLTRKCL